ncbi:hypothetical protein AGOR_G00143560 [Albula goreensis]|uniref:Uncharacterized protein n=1 Tax=Albula goreensis TaxID=1534307 RepID=A0A8T3D5Y4_9TELE|nr:hypothetical protein AGOR_G00143560 [Albula goreensis]
MKKGTRHEVLSRPPTTESLRTESRHSNRKQRHWHFCEVNVLTYTLIHKGKAADLRTRYQIKTERYTPGVDSFDVAQC